MKTKSFEQVLDACIFREKPMEKDKVELLQLSLRIFKEEFKIINKAFVDVSGIKAFGRADDFLSIRSICRSFKKETETFKKIKKLAEKITEKKLAKIDFRENQADQLKVRIKLREFFAPILLAILMQKIKNLFGNKS